MKPRNDKAVKEWATVVKALGEGKQIVLIRKGELISTHDEFFLYPTFTGQTRGKFKDKFLSDFDATVAARKQGKVLIEFYAQIQEVHEIKDSKNLLNMDRYYVWTSSHVEDYFQKTKDKKVYVIILRVFRLIKPELIELPIGARWYRSMSWVNLPKPISTERCVPVLKDGEFKDAVEKIKQIMAPPVKPPEHTKIKEMIYRIGLYQEKPSEKEYSIGSLGKLDVVWKRIHRGNPTHAFEVQIGGDFYKSLAKLKHAFDLWNSIPILVTTAKYEKIARSLMNGSFHEMTRQARIINWKRIEQLHKLEKELREVREELRL